ncbi:MAG: hypothetical protein KDA80_09700 [Planctomycetaceae bacterium]|nr:hypothetical protein [Planctomycetaceae bacterium]
MEIEITQSGDIRERLNELANGQVPTSRRNFIQSVALQTLQETAQNNPVRTGRSRAAWNAAANQINGPTETGGLTTASDHSSDGSTDGQARQSDAGDSTEIIATNAVPYVPYLEYGTSKMAPKAMLRRALLSISRKLHSLFSLS